MSSKKFENQKSQSEQKENKDNKKEDYHIDPENFTKNWGDEHYNEFFSMSNEDKIQFENSKKSTNITDKNKYEKKKNIIITIFDYDNEQKKYIEKETKYINIQNKENIYLKKKTKLENVNNNVNNIVNNNTLKSEKKIGNNNNSIKNTNENKDNEPKNNTKNIMDNNKNSIIEMNEDLIDALTKSDHEEEPEQENNFYNLINEKIDYTISNENYEDEIISEKEKLTFANLTCNKSQYDAKYTYGKRIFKTKITINIFKE